MSEVHDSERGATDHEPLLGNGLTSAMNQAPSNLLESLLSDLRIILFSGIINVLLLLLPFALLAEPLGWSPTIVFFTNFFAMMPLAGLLSFTTEELSKRVGQGIGSLLNVTFGNATELIVGIFALRSGQVKLIQTTMLGSILSSLLFIMGITFVVAGYRKKEFKFSSMIAQTMSSFMFVATGALILPAAFDAGLPDSISSKDGVLALSRGASVVLLIIYICFLFYQLKTHPDVFEEDGVIDDEEAMRRPGPAISMSVCVVTVLMVTVAVSFCSDALVGSIDDVVSAFSISKTFIGLILVPIIGNAAETVTCINLGWKVKMDMVVTITLGACMQVALFLTPFLVVLGWFFDVPMSLSTIQIGRADVDFEIFQAVVIFVSVVFTEYLIMDGSSNWMEGSMLLGVYIIVAISYWLYPDIDTP